MAKTDYIAIKAGKLIDGTGSGPVDNAVVLIEGSRIKAAGKDIQIPPEAQIIDAKGMTIMPGLIDAHMHFWGLEPDDTFIDDMARPRGVRLIKSVNDARNFLASGFTMCKECGGMNGIYLKKAAASGYLTGIPRILSAGYTLNNSYANPRPYMPQEYTDARTSGIDGVPDGELIFCDGVDQCIKAVRYNFSQGADFIKILPKGLSIFNLDELTAIAQTAAEVGRFATMHCDILNLAKNAIRAGVKSIDHASALDDEAVEMGNKAGVVFVSTLLCMQSLIEYADQAPGPTPSAEWAKGNLDKMVKSYQRVKKLGGCLAIGTDNGGERLVAKLAGGSAMEIELLVTCCDYTPMEAIVCATKNSAKACYMEDKTGTIETGKFADIIVVDGDPLADIRVLQDRNKIKMVFLEGKAEINNI